MRTVCFTNRSRKRSLSPALLDPSKMDRVAVFTTFNPVAAQIVCSRLQTAGFDASVEGEAAALNMEGYSLATGGIRVQVPENEKTDARNLIEANE